MVRKFAFYARCGDELRGVSIQLPFADQKLKKGAQARELSCHRSFFLFLGMQAGHPFADRQAVYLLDRKIVAPLDLEQKRTKLLEIARVIPDRMIRNAPLVFQVFEEIFERRLET